MTNFANTSRFAEYYLEDRGHPVKVYPTDPSYAELETEFGSILQIGQTAIHDMMGTGWIIEDGCYMVEDARKKKLAKLKEDFNVAKETCIVETAFGFSVNGNNTARTDINGLLDITADNASIEFCAADNTMHAITREQLLNIRTSVIEYNNNLYAIKWAAREALNVATTLDEIDAVNWTF